MDDGCTLCIKFYQTPFEKATKSAHYFATNFDQKTLKTKNLWLKNPKKQQKSTVFTVLLVNLV